MSSSDHPVRYVITHMGTGRMYTCRVLTFPAQGRYTYATAAEAQEQLTLFEPSLRAKLLGDRADTLRVLAVECWPGHFDPKRTVWPGDNDVEDQQS